jgi:competence protein ComEA
VDGVHGDTPGADPAEQRRFNYDDGFGARPAPRLRWRAGLRAAVLLGLLSLVLGGWFWWTVATGRPEVLPLSDVSSMDGGASEETAGSPESSSAFSADEDDDAPRIVVHIAGAVNKPGVVELSEGSRIHEAIAAAGGSTDGADLNALNLAAVLEDGQKIHVPRQGEAPAEGDPAAGAPGAGAGDGTPGTAPGPAPKVDLNTASVEELGTLPKVGPVLAQRIVDWRTQHGKFKTVEELDAVDGVGPKMLEALLPLVKV